MRAPPLQPIFGSGPFQGRGIMPATPASSFGLPNNGFVPVATISPASTVADPAHNAELYYEGLQRAATLGAKVMNDPQAIDSLADQAYDQLRSGKRYDIPKLQEYMKRMERDHDSQ